LHKSYKNQITPFKHLSSLRVADEAIHAVYTLLHNFGNIFMKTISFVKPLKKIHKDISSAHDFTCATCGAQPDSENLSPVDEGYQNPLSLDALFIQNPASTFFVTVGGENGQLAISENKYLGVSVGDILTVDRALTPTLGRLVLAVSNGAFTLCRFTEHQGRQFLVCGNEKCTAQEVEADEGVYVWGVVSALSRKL
jgi:DNA polymerase V